MKVVQVVSRRYHRGSEVFATTLADSLVRRGHDVEIVALHEPRGDALTPKRAPFVDLGGRNGGNVNPTIIVKLIRYIRHSSPDIVQANGADTLKYTALAKKLSTGSWPLVYRNVSIASRWLRYPAHRVWVRWLLRSVDHVASVGEEARKDMLATFGLRLSKVTTIRGGVNISTVHPQEVSRTILTSFAEVPSNAVLLVHIGSFTREKNHRGLIDAFEAVHTESQHVHLCLLGDGPLRADIEERVLARGLSEHVHMLGMRPDADILVAGADILVLSSLIEGIPGVVLEAAAQRVPAVSTNVGAIHEVIDDGRTGILVPAEDMQSLAAAVLQLVVDPGRRRAMGAAARDFVCHRHDLDRITREFENLYVSAMRANRD